MQKNQKTKEKTPQQKHTKYNKPFINVVSQHLARKPIGSILTASDGHWLNYYIAARKILLLPRAGIIWANYLNTTVQNATYIVAEIAPYKIQCTFWSRNNNQHQQNKAMYHITRRVTRILSKRKSTDWNIQKPLKITNLGQIQTLTCTSIARSDDVLTVVDICREYSV